ncbi:hypothetical protein G7Z17_g592 [Cylindrodendrum hubeiense]|uniref:tyrosinase n=1 Tax=Cylindrodendrum hubeiense TaxID=595255 RepID=A0A9P5LM81_9HYPO|nr:hypothetical protein G7Z17_g592 [Cylindrodendrum hubeiense]
MASNSDSYPITGIQDGLHPDKNELRKVPVRMEIDEWYQSDDPVHLNQKALFFPAFWRFSQMSPHEKLSWYQIAGIHGKPYVAWDEAPKDGATKNEGYCTHASILFTTWHRAYMLLWEYCLNAFYQFEMPDMMPMGHSSLGSADRRTDLRITASGVKLGGVKSDETAFIPYDMCTGTTRHATDDTIISEWVDGNQNNSGIVTLLRDYKFSNGEKGGKKDAKTNANDDVERQGNLSASLRDAFYRLLTINKFEDFGSKRFPDIDVTKKEYVEADYAYDSAEHLHDIMHLFCGGFPTKVTNGVAMMGHMSHVPLAAFDPIFWLHHCVREVTALGYTYPGLEKWQHTKADGTYDRDEHLKSLHCALNKMELKGKMFTVHIFIGDVPGAPPFIGDNSSLGQVFNFSAAADTGLNAPGCGNCRKQEEDKTKVTGRVVLTNALITYYKQHVNPREGTANYLESMEPEHVVPFLKRNLEWRVTCLNEIVDFGDVPSLKISVAVGDAHHYADRNMMSEFNNYKGAYEITEGRPGGANPDDHLYPLDRIYVPRN